MCFWARKQNRVKRLQPSLVDAGLFLTSDLLPSPSNSSTPSRPKWPLPSLSSSSSSPSLRGSWCGSLSSSSSSFLLPFFFPGFLVFPGDFGLDDEDLPLFLFLAFPPFGDDSELSPTLGGTLWADPEDVFVGPKNSGWLLFAVQKT